MMLCYKPHFTGALAHGCGQCLPCLLNKRRQWEVRQVLESFSHDENSFCTLTYAPHNLPDGMSVNKNDLQLFFKRLRKAIEPRRIRYFAAAEYGEQNGAPHYHISLFGMSGNTYIGDAQNYDTGIDILNRAWGLGRTQMVEFNRQTAHYVTKYITKRVSNLRMEARAREFVLMSRMPGLGSQALAHLAEQLKNHPVAWEKIHSQIEVPRTLKINGRDFYLDRYSYNQLLQLIGFTQNVIKHAKDKTAMEASFDMCALFQNAFDPEEASTFRDTYEEENKGKLAKVYGKHHTYLPPRRKS